MGLEPLSVMYDLVVTKFILKSLHSDSNMKGMLLQIESSRAHPFYHHILLATKYLNHQDQHLTFGQSSGRSGGVTSLAEINERLTHYTKMDIDNFKGKLWEELLTNNEERYANYVQERMWDSTPILQPLTRNQKKLFLRTSSLEFTLFLQS